MNEKLRLYEWREHVDAEFCLMIIAENVKEARTIGYNYYASDIGVEPETFIEQRVKWQKGKHNIKGLSKGIVDLLDGLKRGLYSYIVEHECPRCNISYILYCEDGENVMCSKCLEKSSVDNFNKKLNEDELC